MARFKEYDQYDGLGLAELIRRKEIGAEEVCEEAIQRIKELNPKLNAVVTPMYDLVKEQLKAGSPESPFYGVPFLLKDAHHAYKGVPMSQGSNSLKGFVSKHDAEIVRRFKKAGLVVVGKTNTPEFKLAYVTEPKAFGPTRNPWNTDYSCGGSSGGSAAAVASRMVPMASATDEGGSIRVPSSYCGLFGLKPSRGRNPVGPDFTEEWDGMSTSHVVTRSVRDSAAILDATAAHGPGGREAGAPYAIAAPSRPFLEELNQPPEKYRIAYTLRPAYGRIIHSECRKAVESAVEMLRELGHRVEEAGPEIDETDVFLDQIRVMAGQLATKLERISKEFRRPVNKKTVEEQNLAMAAIGGALKVADFIGAKQSWRVAGAAMDRFLEKYDMLLTPTLGQPPVLVGAMEPSAKDRMAMKVAISPAGKLLFANRNLSRKTIDDLVDSVVGPQMPLTPLANITGQPAMSVPLYWTKAGLPIGVQFYGRYGDEAALFRLASQVEQARPWFDRKTPILT
ncbi:MAG: amidase [Proteobacteria bacterium]|nr:amidase [Pseudomonadota bacterium]